MKNRIIEMTNTLQGINSRPDKAEEWISDREDREVEVIQGKQIYIIILKSEDSLKEVQHSIKQHNILTMEVPERNERENEAKNIF